jgi:hypothetical protein
MEKIWYLKSRWGNGGKVFRTEKAFLSAVGENDDRQLFIFKVEESGKAGEMKKNILTSRDRNDQLKTILGEASKYEEAIMQFNTKFAELAKDCAEKRVIERMLKIIGLNKKDFSQLATTHKDYLLFEVSDTVEWYQTVLRCHNFTSLPRKRYVSGKGYSEIDEYIKEAFLEAKESLKKKPTRKKQA